MSDQAPLPEVTPEPVDSPAPSDPVVVDSTPVVSEPTPEAPSDVPTLEDGSNVSRKQVSDAVAQFSNISTA